MAWSRLPRLNREPYQLAKKQHITKPLDGVHIERGNVHEKVGDLH